MEYDREEFKRKFPHLHKELEEVEEEALTQAELQDANRDSLSGHITDVISYIRRARTDSEAVEIVNYLGKRGEISEEHSRALLKQIQEEGVRSFGSLRTWGHYEKELRKEQIICGDDEEEDGDEGFD
nr:DUF2095 family protein [Candidatus Njordarchaeum guaymaensis]